MPFVAGNKKLPAFLRIEKEGEECLADLHKEKVWEGGRDRRVGLAIQAQVLGKVRCLTAQNRSHSLAESPRYSALDITKL